VSSSQSPLSLLSGASGNQTSLSPVPATTPLWTGSCTKRQAIPLSDIQATDISGEFSGYIRNLIVSGIADNAVAFNGLRDITREEYIKMLVNALCETSWTTRDATTTFSDVQNDEFTSYIDIALGEGWVSGYSDGTFRPDEPISRGEAVKILTRAL
jgi:hypothetical protein